MQIGLHSPAARNLSPVEVLFDLDIHHVDGVRLVEAVRMEAQAYSPLRRPAEHSSMLLGRTDPLVLRDREVLDQQGIVLEDIHIVVGKGR